MSIFITLEGSEGCGKTTQLKALVTYLRSAGYPLITTREPGGTPIGDQIRDVLLNRDNTTMQQRTEILLFQASRAQLVEQIIRPNLERGNIVLSDRYADSTIAYQGYGYQLNLEHLENIITFATGGLKPHLTLLLDIDVEEGLRRRNDDGDWNRLDAYDLAFYQRVRSGYHILAQADPDRWVIIDAGQPTEKVQQDIRQVVMERLG